MHLHHVPTLIGALAFTSLLAPAHAGGVGIMGTAGVHQENVAFYDEDENQFINSQMVPNYGSGVYIMLGDRDEAEDVAQETFLSLHRHGHRFRSESRFSTFVYQVAANAALNRRRSLGRNRNRTQKLAERQAAGDDLPTAPRDPEDAAHGAELGVHVRKALETLSPPLRMPLVLYDIEGLAYGEIARVLGVAEGTVKSRIHRARQALREQLGGLVEADVERIERHREPLAERLDVGLLTGPTAVERQLLRAALESIEFAKLGVREVPLGDLGQALEPTLLLDVHP